MGGKMFVSAPLTGLSRIMSTEGHTRCSMMPVLRPHLFHGGTEDPLISTRYTGGAGAPRRLNRLWTISPFLHRRPPQIHPGVIRQEEDKRTPRDGGRIPLPVEIEKKDPPGEPERPVNDEPGGERGDIIIDMARGA